MAKKSDSYIVLGYTAAVIGDAHKGSSAVFYLDSNVFSTRVYSVLNQLLDYGGRTFNDLARRDKLRDVLVQNIYYSHAVTAFLFKLVN